MIYTMALSKSGRFTTRDYMVVTRTQLNAQVSKVTRALKTIHEEMKCPHREIAVVVTSDPKEVCSVMRAHRKQRLFLNFTETELFIEAYVL